jgi:hypothetical protein
MTTVDDRRLESGSFAKILNGDLDDDTQFAVCGVDWKVDDQ